jgi:hypothetical protein
LSVPFSSRLAGICAGVAACAALFGAAPALASVTSSTITSVTTPDGFAASPVGSQLFSGWDFNASPSQTTVVSGTVTTDDNFAADTVEIRCYYGDGGSYNNIDSNVPVNPDGTFTSSPSTYNDATCRMAAVDPSYSNPVDPGTFRGPVYGVGYYSQSKISGGGLNDGQVYDFWSDAHQAKGYMEWVAAGDCGITWSQVFGASFTDYSWYSPFECAGAMYTGTGGDGYGRSEVQVDGKNALNSYGAASGGLNYYDGSTWHSPWDNEGFPGLTWTHNIDPATGDMTATESEPLVFCGDTYPATAQCDPADPYKFKGTGVHFDRAIKQSKDGLQSTATDTYTSTDGAQHAIDVEYDHFSIERQRITYDVPGSGFKTYSSGDTAELPAQAVGTIYVKDAYYNDGDPTLQMPGAFTYTTQPDRMFFTGANNSSQGQFVLQYRRTVPAGGSISITHVYTQGSDVASVRALATQAEDAAQAPAVSIDSPADGSKVASSDATVIGKASDNDGVPSLKVNGVPTPVNPDGSWSQHLALTPGANTITAVATDKAGNSTQAQETVTSAPATAAGAASTNCQVPKLVGLATAQAVAGLQAANCAVGKQTATTSPTVKAGGVAAQNIAPGTIAANGTPVDIAVSTGAYSGAQLAKKTVRMHGRNVTIQVKCPGSSPVTNGTVKLRAITGKHATLGTKAFQCPKSGTRTVTFTVSKANAKAIQGRSKTSALAYIVSRGSPGEAASTRANLTVLPAK